MTCPQCNQQHPPYYTYCTTTGQQLDVTLTNTLSYQTAEFCVSCGQRNEYGFQCCTQCGHATIAAVAKKSTMNQLINQGIQSISTLQQELPKPKLTNKTLGFNLKEFCTGHVQYIKRTPLILTPAILSITFVMLIAYFILSYLKDALYSAQQYIGPEIPAILFNINQVRQPLLAELGISATIPDFPIYSTILLALHNMSYHLSASSGTDTATINIVNALNGFLIFPILALLLVAIIFGRLAKKYAWNFWYGVGYTAILYTGFIFIFTLRASYNISLITADSQFILDANASIFKAMITALLLVVTIFSFFGYIAYRGKNIFIYLQYAPKYFNYYMYAFAATFIGIAIHCVQAYSAITKELNAIRNSSFIDYYALSLIPDSLFYVLSFYVGTTNWILSMFGNLSGTILDYSNRHDVSYSWFFNTGADKVTSADIQSYTLLMNPIVLVILTMALLVGVGYLLSKETALSYKDMLIAAAIFTAIQCILPYFFTITIDANLPREMLSVKLAYSFISLLLGSFIVAFVSFFIGSYCRKAFGKQ